MGKSKKNIVSHKNLCVENSTHQIPSDKVQGQLDLQEFAEQTRLKLDTLTNSVLCSKEEYDSVKKEVLMLRSDLDRFINRFVGLECKFANAIKVSTNAIEEKAKVKSSHFETRYNNVILHGVKMGNDECAKEETTDFFSNKLGVNVTVTEAILLGVNKNSVLVKLKSAKERASVFRNCHKLKGTEWSSLSIVEDLTKEERAKKLQNMPQFREEKAKGNKAYFRRANLYVNGKLFNPDAFELLKPSPKSQFDQETPPPLKTVEKTSEELINSDATKLSASSTSYSAKAKSQSSISSAHVINIPPVLKPKIVIQSLPKSLKAIGTRYEELIKYVNMLETIPKSDWGPAPIKAYANVKKELADLEMRLQKYC